MEYAVTTELVHTRAWLMEFPHLLGGSLVLSKPKKKKIWNLRSIRFSSTNNCQSDNQADKQSHKHSYKQGTDTTSNVKDSNASSNDNFQAHYLQANE